MNKVLPIFFAVLLSACATSSELYLPDGSSGHKVVCSSYAQCAKKAGKLCGASGYSVISSGPGAFAGYMIFGCNSDTTGQTNAPRINESDETLTARLLGKWECTATLTVPDALMHTRFAVTYMPNGKYSDSGIIAVAASDEANIRNLELSIASTGKWHISDGLIVGTAQTSEVQALQPEGDELAEFLRNSRGANYSLRIVSLTKKQAVTFSDATGIESVCLRAS